MYAVWFVRDPQTQDGGFIYLPGPGEPWFRLNAGTMERPDQDGKWHEAARPWSRALAEALDRASKPSMHRETSFSDDSSTRSALGVECWELAFGV
jgi:hypothetical protein